MDWSGPYLPWAVNAPPPPVYILVYPSSCIAILFWWVFSSDKGFGLSPGWRLNTRVGRGWWVSSAIIPTIHRTSFCYFSIARASETIMQVRDIMLNRMKWVCRLVRKHCFGAENVWIQGVTFETFHTCAIDYEIYVLWKGEWELWIRCRFFVQKRIISAINYWSTVNPC
jgi:hypothetical protein